MAKNIKYNGAKAIRELKEELERNDKILAKNTQQEKLQVQVALYNRGYPQSSPMFDVFIEKNKLEASELRIKLLSGFKVIHPMFEFQTVPDWISIQMERANVDLANIESNLAEVEKNVKEIKEELAEQNQRILARREQIIELLKGYGENVTDLKKNIPEYIR